jgi:hypothetical protein
MGKGKETDIQLSCGKLCRCGCDPDGVVEECGGMCTRGLRPRARGMGMLRIPQICCTPGGVQEIDLISFQKQSRT